MSDAYGGELVMNLPEERFIWTPNSVLPASDELATMDTIMIFGPLADVVVAVQLSGVVKLALRRSKGTLVFAYPVHFHEPDDAFVNDLGHPLAHGNAPNAVYEFPAEFDAYFTEYGTSGAGFLSHQVEGATVIGWIHENEGAGVPTALCWEIAPLGVLYVVPYQLSRAGDPARMAASLFNAVSTHRDALAVGLPEYLTATRLGANEEALLAEIDALEQTIAEKRGEAARSERWRHLIGRASGTPLAQLTVEALNVVLHGTEHRAETREDVGAEDFWVVEDDRDFALAEAKGVAGGIARANVSQVDSHREERGLPPEFPGVLVVNAFRGDPDLARKQNEDVAPNVLALARSQNVLIVRTWDLYQLVGRRLNGEDMAEILLAALRDSEGGWLRVDEDGVRLIR